MAHRLKIDDRIFPEIRQHHFSQARMPGEKRVDLAVNRNRDQEPSSLLKQLSHNCLRGGIAHVTCISIRDPETGVQKNPGVHHVFFAELEAGTPVFSNASSTTGVSTHSVPFLANRFGAPYT